MDMQKITQDILKKLAKEKGIKFSREVKVEKAGVGGDYKINREQVTISTEFLLKGKNPIQTVDKVLCACVSFDQRDRYERERSRIEAEESLRRALRIGVKLLGEEKVRNIMREEGAQSELQEGEASPVGSG